MLRMFIICVPLHFCLEKGPINQFGNEILPFFFSFHYHFFCEINLPENLLLFWVWLNYMWTTPHADLTMGFILSSYVFNNIRNVLPS